MVTLCYFSSWRKGLFLKSALEPQLVAIKISPASFWRGSPANFVPGDARSGFCAGAEEGCGAAMRSCLLAVIDSPILFPPLDSESSGWLVTFLRQHPEMWHGVCEPLCMHPYNTSPPPKEARGGHGTDAAPGAPPVWGVPPSHQHLLPEGLLRRPALLPTPNPKASPRRWVSLPVLLFSPLPPHSQGFGDPFTPPHLPIFTVLELQRGGRWLWEGSSRWFIWG